MQTIQKIINEEFLNSIKIKNNDEYKQILLYKPTNIIDAIMYSIEYDTEKLTYLLEYSKIKYSKDKTYILGEMFKKCIVSDNIDALIILIMHKLFPRDHHIENKIIMFIYDKNRIDLTPMCIENGISNKRFFSLIYRHPEQSKKSNKFILDILSMINTTKKSNADFIKWDMPYMQTKYNKLIQNIESL